MKKSKLYFSLLILLMNGGLVAQSEYTTDILPKEKRLHHEIGINASALLDKLIKSQNDTSLDNNVYNLRYKFIVKNWALRAGYGWLYNSEDQKVEGFEDVKSSKNLFWNAEIGIERQINLSSKWKTNVGLMGVYYYRAKQNILDSGFDRLIDTYRSDEYGFGLSFELQYTLVKRLSIGLTSSAIYSIYSASQQEVFDVFTSFNKPKKENTGTHIKYYGPQTIFINYTF